jgi:hypothetical protein
MTEASPEKEDGAPRMDTLYLQRAKPLGLRHFQAAKLGPPLVECRFADPVTATNIRRHRTRFLFLQNPDDLLIVEPAAFHSSVPLRNRLYRRLETFQGSMSHGARSPICSRSKSRPLDHPQPGAAKARWSALSAPLLCEILPSCMCSWLISFAAQYVLRGAAQNRDRSTKPSKACFKCGHCHGNIVGVQLYDHKVRIVDPAQSTNERCKLHRSRPAEAIDIIEQGAGC